MGFCLQYGLGVELDLADSLKYYKMSADQNHRGGAFHYALCLHYGIGVETDLEEAARYYERASFQRNFAGSRHAFRIRRSQNEAKFSRNQFPELQDSRLDVLDRCIDAQPFSSPTLLSDYRTNAHLNHKGSSRTHSPIIGTGGASFVTLEHRGDGAEFAIKHLYIVNCEQYRFVRELEVLIKLNHPCILRILACLPPELSGPATGHAPIAEIHTESAENGSLASALKRAKEGRVLAFWNPTGIGKIICGIVLGMRFVHSSGFIHRDLKPGNILINGAGEALIADFGTTRRSEHDYAWTPEGGSYH